MTVAAHHTLSIIFENRDLFFMLMDRHAATDTANGFMFRLSEYDQVLLHAAEGMDNAEKARFFDALSPDNLRYNGLLEIYDPADGCFSLNSHVEGLLRHLDAKRIRELSDYDLNILISQIDGASSMAHSYVGVWDRRDVDYLEVFSAIKDTFYRVAATLRTNVRSLEGHSDRLSELVESVDFSESAQYIRYRETLKEISQIYQRNVLPTLQFLDPNLDVKRENYNGPIVPLHRDHCHAPMKVMQLIVDHFDRRGAHDDSLQLSRLLLDIKSLGRNIVAVADRLTRYLKMDDDDRKFYDRAEERFNELLRVVIENQRGQQKNFLLKPENPIFDGAGIIGRIRSYGLTNAQAVNWPNRSGRSIYDEILRVKLDQLTPSAEIKKASSLTHRSRVDEKKTERLMRSLDCFNVELPINDAHKSLHEFLVKNLEGYDLSWLGEAVEYLRAHGRLRETFYFEGANLKTIDYKGYRLGYRNAEFLPAEDP